MTKEELQRIGIYTDKIKAANNNIAALTEAEKQDLQLLLVKWMAESEVIPESTVIKMHGIHPIYSW